MPAAVHLSFPERCFVGTLARLNPKCKVLRDHRGYIQAVSAAFGIDAPKDEQRFEITRQQVLPLFAKPANWHWLPQLAEILPTYKAWTASGAHRFMPLGLAVRNMLEGRNIFSLDPLQQFSPDIRQYMTQEHPFYANSNNIPARYMPSYFPELLIDIPQRVQYSWLDIGSAPKTGGAPTLNVLMEMLPPNFIFYGADIAMPFFKIEHGKTTYSDYLDPDTKQFKSEARVNGITYYNGNIPEYNVLGDQFLLGRRFNFMSICMTLHHLSQKQKHEKLPFTTQKIVDAQGHDFSEGSIITTTKSQQAVLGRLLSHLEIGGILFLDPHCYPFTPDFSAAHILESNDDMFFIIQREAENIYRIYDRTPIVFDPPRSSLSPSLQREFLDGHNIPEDKLFNHPGILSYGSLSQADREALQELFNRADALIVCYQSWKKGRWGRVQAVVEGIRSRESIYDLFCLYLANISDEGALDSDLKRQLLSDVKAL